MTEGQPSVRQRSTFSAQRFFVRALKSSIIIEPGFPKNELRAFIKFKGTEEDISLRDIFVVQVEVEVDCKAWLLITLFNDHANGQ